MYYPGNSNLHLSQAKSGGAVIGFRLKDETKAQAFVDALTLPLVSVSLGGVETILHIQPQCLMQLFQKK